MDKFNFLDKLGKAHDEIAQLSKNNIYNSVLEETQDKVKALNAIQGYDSYTRYGHIHSYWLINYNPDVDYSNEGKYWIHSHGVTSWLTGNESYDELLTLFQDHIG